MMAARPAVQPGVVLGRAEVAQPDPVPAAGGGPGDDPLDHRPGWVGLPEFPRAGLGAGGAQQAFVRVDLQAPAVFGGGALCRSGQPAHTAPKVAYRLVLIVRVCPAGQVTVPSSSLIAKSSRVKPGHGRAQRHRLDHRVMPGLLVVRAGLTGAVVRVTVNLQARDFLPAAARAHPRRRGRRTGPGWPW